VWTTDGTTQSTTPITSFETSCAFQGLGSIVSGSTLFLTYPSFRAIDTAGHSVLLSPDLQDFEGVAAFQGKVYFYGRTDLAWALWESDGTPEGTRRVWNMPDGYFPVFFVPILTDGTSLLLTVARDIADQEIWRSDGTPGGTVRLLRSSGLLAADRVDVARLGSSTFLAFDDELWRTDGTPAGTHEVLRNEWEPLFAYPQGLVVMGGSLFLFDTTGIGPHWNLWRTDGTPEGSVLLETFGPLDGYPPHDMREAPFVMFWFFDPTNVEVMLKVLDGIPLSGRFWVFYGALSNVEYTLKVTDTQTGAIKEYRNPSGRFASVADTNAF
jgi:ELWxxDGT repeat protein